MPVPMWHFYVLLSLSASMGDNLRPVRLRKVVLGFPFDDQKGSDFQFDMSLSYRLARIINTYSDGKPTLVVRFQTMSSWFYNKLSQTRRF